jgi:hypothetical protein
VCYVGGNRCDDNVCRCACLWCYRNVIVEMMLFYTDDMSYLKMIMMVI